MPRTIAMAVLATAARARVASPAIPPRTRSASLVACSASAASTWLRMPSAISTIRSAIGAVGGDVAQGQQAGELAHDLLLVRRAPGAHLLP